MYMCMIVYVCMYVSVCVLAEFIYVLPDSSAESKIMRINISLCMQHDHIYVYLWCVSVYVTVVCMYFGNE